MNIKDFFRRRRAPEAAADLRQAYLDLYELQRDHRLLEVRVDGVGQVFQSLILHVDPEQRTLWIDEFFPSDFVGLPQQKINISARLAAGKKLRFDAVILAMDLDGGAPAYTVTMPHRLASDQRRSAFRLAVAEHSPLTAFLSGADRECAGAIRDISVNGLRLAVDGEAGEWLQENQQCGASFEFAGMQLSCALDVRNIRDDDEHRCRYIGGEFIGLSKTDERQLERAITHAQRQRMRGSVVV